MTRSRKSLPCAFQPTDAEISKLIQRASQHAMGTGFLKDGALDAVSATFGVHAFTVEKAREQLFTGQLPAETAGQ
jgi:hypothetical protein